MKLCTCTWDIPRRADLLPVRAPVRIPPRFVECPLHQQTRGEADQPMVTGGRVPVL
jgi:hypothetical protein